MAADPKRSEGARLERKAFRSHLRRRLAKASGAGEKDALDKTLKWVLTRSERYDKKAGGL